MHQVTLIYLHGFLSGGQSSKGQAFKQAVESNPVFLTYGSEHNVSLKVLTPTYPIATPKVTVDYIEDLIQTELSDAENQATANGGSSKPKFALIGSSMGGFYAQYFAQKYRVPFVMINPALDPISIMQNHFGTHINPMTQEEICIDEAYLTALEQYYCEMDSTLPALLLQDKADEVIPYQPAFDVYQTTSNLQVVHCFEGGDHAFQHMGESIPIIRSFLQTYLVGEV